VPKTLPDHYATLGLHRRCSAEQIRNAYRILAKEHHPDLNADAAGSVVRTQELNAAYAVLGDADARKAYDRELAVEERSPRSSRGSRPTEGEGDADEGGRLRRKPAGVRGNLRQDVRLRPEEFLRGTRLEVRVDDPGNAAGAEVYPLEIPAGTAPGARFTVRREGAAAGGVLTVRTTVRPDPRFRLRGSDLRCDLRIPAALARRGGPAMVRGLDGMIRVQVPPGIARGEELVVAGEGLPTTRGGRGDLCVRVMYQPDIRITRRSSGDGPR
jgi:curved DNA-binding protein